MRQKIHLTDQEVTRLQKFTHTGVAPAREITRANILLGSHEGSSDLEMCSYEHVNRKTCYEIRKRYAQGGIERALHDAPRPGGKKVLTKEDEAEVIAIYCSDPPDGNGQWTMELLTKEYNKKSGKHVSKNTIWRVILRSPEKPWRKKNVVHSPGNGRIPETHV